jgi:hypothetical protein
MKNNSLLSLVSQQEISGKIFEIQKPENTARKRRLCGTLKIENE